MLRIILLFAVSMFLSGCTFVGMGIGAGTPRYVPVTNVSNGATVRAETIDGDVIEGRVTRGGANALVLETSGREYELPLDRIRKMAQRKSHIGTGAAIGGVIDGLCILAGAIALIAGTHSSLGSLFSGGY